MSETTLEELFAVVRRDLGADAVRIFEADEEPPADGASLRCDLPGGRRLVAFFEATPSDAEARHRRLEMLVSAFSDLLEHADRQRPSRPPARSLNEELAALTHRVGAVEAVVIDARSPIIWGHAGEQPVRPRDVHDAVERLRAPGVLHAVDDGEEAAARIGIASAEGLRVDPRAADLVPRAVCARHRAFPVARVGSTLVVAMADPEDVEAIYALTLASGLEIEPLLAGESTSAFFAHLDDDGYDAALAAIPPDERPAREADAARARDAWTRLLLSERAIAEIRAHSSEMEELHKGGHIRHTVTGDRFGLVARSFASIYVVILVFDGPFDELLAKRALTHALPTIERLVLALPPLEPPPRLAGVVALRRRRKR